MKTTALDRVKAVVFDHDHVGCIQDFETPNGRELACGQCLGAMAALLEKADERVEKLEAIMADMVFGTGRTGALGWLNVALNYAEMTSRWKNDHQRQPDNPAPPTLHEEFAASCAKNIEFARQCLIESIKAAKA